MNIKSVMRNMYSTNKSFINNKNQTKMGKYSKNAQKKIETVMNEYGEGKLKSSSGEKVTDRKQAIAIAISEAKSRGYKTPKRK